MNTGRVGEERGSKEMDGCPLTVCFLRKYVSLSAMIFSRTLPMHSNSWIRR
jgi:hypothetical protein